MKLKESAFFVDITICTIKVQGVYTFSNDKYVVCYTFSREF